jgi:PAS domain S-box-containing protein
VVHDLTESRRSERELKESEARMNRSQEIAHLGSWELDLETNRLTWSDEVYRIFGLEPQEFGATYEAFLSAVHPEDRAAVDAAYSGSLSNGLDSYEIEHRVVRRSTGEVRVVHEKCEHTRDAAGRIIRSIGMVHDITERKRAEAALAETAQKLERSNRELEQFAFVASHDLQEPLRKIEMFGGMLASRGEQLDDRQRDLLERMQGAARRMRSMVDGLLQLSRINTRGQPFTRVDLSETAAEVLSDLEHQVRRSGGQVTVGELPEVEGDPLQLQSLLQNLIGNALKYHLPETPPVVRVYARRLPGSVQIVVEDEGIGFNQGDAGRMFKPFERLVGRGDYEGSGMGLAICRKIVERHGGQIAALGAPGKGAAFVATLPVEGERR